MARKALLIPLAALGLALAGCDPAVQARYQPTSVDEVFGPFSRVGGVDDEVYELPASPPVLDEQDLRPRVCRTPGQLLKPTDQVAIAPDRTIMRRAEASPLFSTYEPPPASPPPGPAYRIASWEMHQPVGAREPIWTKPYAPTIEPGRSVYRNPPERLGAYQRFERIWCDDAANLR